MFPMKKKLIVSAVRKIKDKVVVHYTDGTIKEFTVLEWEYSYGQGRSLWEEHEKEFKNPENFDG